MAALTIEILTLFPGMFEGPFGESMLGKARQKGFVDLRVHDLRRWAEGRHKQADDRQFGGGAGMLLKVEPIYRALKELCGDPDAVKGKPWVVYLSPQGKPLSTQVAKRLTARKHLIFLCGHYEGIDERALRWVDEEVSIGDYVVTGGELPAMVLTDALCRMVPGVVKEWESVENDSFYKPGLLDCSHYTRPALFMGMQVPETLVSGNHKAIEQWRRKSALQNTLEKRPELLDAEARKALKPGKRKKI